MEFVGKSVKKEFEGYGVFEGVIQSYDPSSGFFKVLYEDGDFEEIDLSEVSLLLSNSSSVGSIQEKSGIKVGRKPKRRCPNGLRDPGKFDGNLDVDDDSLGENFDVEAQLGQNLENLVDVNVSVSVDVNFDNCFGGNGIVGGGLDLNHSLECDDGVENGMCVGGIDLNVSVVEASDFDEGGIKEQKLGSLGSVNEQEVKKEREFDLNLGFDDDGPNGVSGSMDVEACVSPEEDLRNVVVGGVDLKNLGTSCSDGRLEVHHLEGVTPDRNSGRRKKRKVEKNVSSSGKTVLRRSARRAKSVTFVECEASSALVEAGGNDLVLSGAGEEGNDKPSVQALGKVVEPEVIPSKIDLPASSVRLNLEGIPVADLFSVYSCLRSFSTLLYLSPFELEDFVAALKSRISDLLIDFTHVSILQKLRIHLESLMREGSESASMCLRNLNWDLLDEITWPVFMVEYLLIHGSQLKPGFNLHQLKLFDGDYYKQPADVKIELLRCLCDDVVEVESIRAELSRRRLITDVYMDVDRTISTGPGRKRKISIDASGDFLLTEDMEDVADGNSDECCLCKMDGNLICCDGCPAAYHSKCVGIVSSLLPEGDWFCPECVIGRPSVGKRPQKFSRGAKLLGIDPHGRLFFSCFNYLLVSDSCEADSPFNYYHKDDLPAVFQFLRSADSLYGPILRAITQHWAIATDLDQSKGALESEKCILADEDLVGRKNKSSMIECQSHEGTKVSEPPDLSAAHMHCSATESPLTSSEGSEEFVQENGIIQNSRYNVTARGTVAKRISASKRKKKHSLSGKSKSPDSKVRKEDTLEGLSGYCYVNSYKFARTAASVVEELLRKPSDKVCVNVPKTEEEIISIQLKIILMKSTNLCWTTIQDLIGERQKENCGWCYCCRFSVENRVCLFNIKSNGSVPESLKVESDAILSKWKKYGHLVDVICFILCMEERLKGLLLGPWLSPRYSELWRSRVLKACDVSSLKIPLILLVSNLHPSALSADWSKHVDPVTTMGSACHFVATSRVSSKNVISRKKGRYADTDTDNKSSTAGKGLSLFWWRGGMTSRSLFNWKVIPRSLASKAARKAGFMKIPEMLYSENSENTRRSKFVTWRAAVEAAASSEQLALQVRELNMFIRWDDIENTHSHFLLDKESLKSFRLFKKVIIRRKSIEGTSTKYLVDFGKRRSIPEVVIQHGVKLEDSDGEKKRYWLDESHVPLHLLKTFEERRIIRKAGKINSNKGQKVGKVKKKTFKEKGFEYLFLKAEGADNYQCGHCNKNVLISEAVSCQHCNGYFHKRHAMKFSEGVTARCTYTCHRCWAGKQVKPYSRKGSKKLGKLRLSKKLKVDRRHLAISKNKIKNESKPLPREQRLSLRNAKKLHDHEQSGVKLRKSKQKKGKKFIHDQKIGSNLSYSCQRNGRKLNNCLQSIAVENTSVSDGITLRRSARKSKPVALQSDVLVGGVKRKRNECGNGASEMDSKSSFRNRRTPISRPYWVNGNRLSRKPNDERVTKFKRKNLLFESECSAGVVDQPTCSLCLQQKHSPALYVACDVCEDWFHGDAFGLNEGNIKYLIGFKCHACRERSAPVCPFGDLIRSEVTPSEATKDQNAEIGKAGSPEPHNSEDPANFLELPQKSTDGAHYHEAQLPCSELRMEDASHGSIDLISDSIAEPSNKLMNLDETSALERKDTELNES